MTNIPKPELERGAYIVYTDESGEVLSPGSTGGGGVVFLEAEYNNEGDAAHYVPKFTYNDAKNAFLAGNFLYVRVVYSADNVYTHYESFAVDQLVDNGTDEFTLTTTDPSFKATSPDELMEQEN